MSLLITVIVVLLFSMVQDLLKRGFFVWHRESVGDMMQYLLWVSCLLYTAIKVRHYIGEFEELGYSVVIIGPND
jgi:hypothetical protein